MLWIRITLMWIRMRMHIRLIALLRIQIQIFILCGSGFLIDAGPDPVLWNRNRWNRNFLTSGTGTVINYGSGTGTRYKIMY